mmetsp:Transcript_78679/g.156439  ORF Transcript_78679/g.156439 Transcript_78679/m.156439 type:complete len:435 (+) Transcript_78679:209-1513(+)
MNDGGSAYGHTRGLHHRARSSLFHLAAILDANLYERPVVIIRGQDLDGLDGLHPLQHLAEDDVAAVEVRRGSGRNVELRAVGISPRVGHTEQPGLSVLRLKALIGEVGPIDGGTTGAIEANKVAALDHKAVDHPVDWRTLVVHRRARKRMYALLAGAERTEVFGCLWHLVRPQLEDDPSCGRCSRDGELEPDLRVGFDKLVHAVGGLHPVEVERANSLLHHLGVKLVVGFRGGGVCLLACFEREAHLLVVRFNLPRCIEVLSRVVKLVKMLVGQRLSEVGLNTPWLIVQRPVARLERLAVERRVGLRVGRPALVGQARLLLLLRHLDEAHRFVEPADVRERVLLRDAILGHLDISARVADDIHHHPGLPVAHLRLLRLPLAKVLSCGGLGGIRELEALIPRHVQHVGLLGERRLPCEKLNLDAKCRIRRHLWSR